MATIKPAAELIALLPEARNSALSTSNALICAESWLREPNPDEDDDRDPAAMLDAALTEAERNAEQAYAMVKRIRELTQLTK